MTLARKDVRHKIDPDLHAAFERLCRKDGLEIGQAVEVLIRREVVRRHAEMESAREVFDELGLAGKIREWGRSPK